MQKKVGPAWADRGRPPEGYFTKRTAEAWLQEVLSQARRGTLPGLRSPAVMFAEAAEEWMRLIEQDRGRKPSTVKDYRNVLRSRLLPTFGERPIDSITPADIEHWRHSLEGLSNRSKNELLIQLHGIFRRAQQVYGLESNPLALVEKHPLRPSGDIEVFSPEEVWSLVRAAASETDAAIFLTAAFTGLRLGELLALRWRDVDFSGTTIRVRASYALGALTTPKSGKLRAVPLAPDVASALSRAGTPRALGGGGRPGVRRRGGRLSRWLSTSPSLQGCACGRRTPRTALPRPAPHIRHPADRQG